MMFDKNQATYRASKIVRYYEQLNQLQPAEKVILENLASRLPNMKMLDIGIGGGRTTQYFAPLVPEYVGIDYSTEMIASCKQKFAYSHPDISLKVVDAREMSQFADNYFDFILFSFNGIDYVNYSDRLKILQEIARVGKSGGYFCFSSHNLQGIAREFNYKKHLSWNPLTTYVNLTMFAFLKFFNRSINFNKIKNADYLTIRDESHNFSLETFYIKPQAQIEQLKSSFKDIEIYSWQSGKKIIDLTHSAINLDMWLYYLGVIN